MTDHKDVSTRCAELRALIERSPDLQTCNLHDPQIQRWLGQAHEAVEASGDLLEAVQFRTRSDSLDSPIRNQNAAALRGMLQRLLARLESKMPNLGAAFLAKGDVWLAFTLISDIFGQATSDLLVVDPYLSDSILREYAERLAEGIRLRLLTTKTKHTTLLTVAAEKWRSTHHNRPLDVRFSPYASIHDRIIAVDKREVWIVTQSLKDLATNAPATVTRFDEDLTPRKLEAYEQIWARASDVI
jgi:hypothetical protein